MQKQHSLSNSTTSKILDYIDDKDLDAGEKKAFNFYEGRQDDYDKYLHLTFQTYNENEIEVRKKMISNLNLERNSIILEIAAGTGRDSLLIAEA